MNKKIIPTIVLSLSFMLALPVLSEASITDKVDQTANHVSDITQKANDLSSKMKEYKDSSKLNPDLQDQMDTQNKNGNGLTNKAITDDTPETNDSDN